MNERKDNRLMAALIIDSLVGIALWALLIVLKATGHSSLHWAVVLSGIVWIVWLLMGLSAMMAAIVGMIQKLKRLHRRRKIERRTIKQAKAVGVWGKPKALGGRALELMARKCYGIKRLPGESDKDLRRRCMTKADNEYAESGRNGVWR